MNHFCIQERHEAESAEKVRQLEAKDREIASRDQHIAQQRGRIQQLQSEMEVGDSVGHL